MPFSSRVTRVVDWILVFVAAAVATYVGLALVAYVGGLEVFVTKAGARAFGGAGLLVALGLLAVRALPSRVRTNVALLTLSMGGSILVAEYALGIAVPTRAAVAAKAGVMFDPRPRDVALRDLRTLGIRVYPGVGGHSFIFNDLVIVGGVSRAPMLFPNETGEYFLYLADEHGFHNPIGLHGDRVKILALGDSFTQGCCIRSDLGYVARIRQVYPRTLNLGIGGNGPLLMLASFREYGEVLTPAHVLWFFDESNDLDDVKQERRHPLLLRYLEDDRFTQGLRDRQVEIDTRGRAHFDQGRQTFPPAGRNYLFPGLETVKLSRMRVTIHDGMIAAAPHTAGRVELETLGAALRQVTQRTAAWGGRVTFVYLPEHLRYSAPRYANPLRDDVLRLVREIGLPIVDLHEVFRGLPDPLAIFPLNFPSPHYGVVGHTLVAEAVLRALETSMAPAGDR